jgi:hypothetical protein
MKPQLFVLLLAAAAVLALAAACSDDDGGEDGQTTLDVTFDGVACTYDGPANVSAGQVTFVFDNQSQASARLDVGKLDEGKTMDDLLEADAQVGTEAEELGRPPWISGGDVFESPAGETTTNELTLVSAGDYSLICLQDSAFTASVLTAND